MSAGILLAAFLLSYTGLKLVWNGVADPVITTYHQTDYKIAAWSLSIFLLGVAAAVLLGAVALIPVLAWGYLGTFVVLFLWQVLDSPTTVKLNSNFYALFVVAVEIAMIVFAIIAL